MGSYATYDFSESLDRTGIDPGSIDRVIAAWGDSSEGYGQWTGGFLMALKDGRFAYLTGWCDTTGWGCQDGADLTYYAAEPPLASLEDGEWDPDPADLNRFLVDPKGVGRTHEVSDPGADPKVEPDDTTCNERKVFWPDDESCDAVCTLPAGHDGPHEDAILGEWSEW